jgi:hypothetical protein
MLKHRSEIFCLEIYAKMGNLKEKYVVEIDPTLLVRLGTPNRFRPNYILVEPMLTTTTSKLLIYINFSVFNIY